MQSEISPNLNLKSGNILLVKGIRSEYMMTLWDTAGQERYQSLIPLYLRNAKGIFFVCDVTAKNTIPTLNAIYTSLSDVDPPTVIYLVGNKIDLEPSITTESNYPELHQWATDHNMFFRVVSAKTGRGIEELFCSMATSIFEASMNVLQTNERILHPNQHNLCC